MKKNAQKDSLRYSEDSAWNIFSKYLNVKEFLKKWVNISLNINLYSDWGYQYAA